MTTPASWPRPLATGHDGAPGSDDLVSVTLTRLYRTWSRARQASNLDAYVRAMLTNAFLDEGRRPWRREEATDAPPDRPGAETHPAIVDRAELAALLTALPRPT